MHYSRRMDNMAIDGKVDDGINIRSGSPTLHMPQARI
jgi:hypothetical protein